MLRVRPIISTPSATAYALLLRALGMNCVEERDGWQLFDSGNGKVALRPLPEGGNAHTTVRFGFELRDAAIFVQRTLADGTHAELLSPEPGTAELGPAAKVTAPDGFTFQAHPSKDLSLPRSAASAPAGPAASQLTVVQTWHTPYPAEAGTVLANIGAKLVHEMSGGGALFRAKNGGLAATAQGGESGVVLGFEYDGDLPDLAARLAAAGVPAAVTGDVVEVNTPDGGRFLVAASQSW